MRHSILASALLSFSGALAWSFPQPQPGSQLAFATLHYFTNYSVAIASGNALILGRDGNLYGAVRFANYSSSTTFGMTTNGQVLWSFGGAGFDMIQGADGNLYIADGDAYGVSKDISSVTTNGLYRWDLSIPNAGYGRSWLTLGGNGDIFETCPNGGSNNFGQIVCASTNGTLKWSFSFGLSNGATPSAPLIQGTDANLYGATTNGGQALSPGQYAGTIFSITPNGALNWSFAFNGTNGFGPFGQIIQGCDGNLYGETGTTFTNGAFGRGILYSLTTNGMLNWTTSVANPTGSLVQGSNGNLYAGSSRLLCVSTNGNAVWASLSSLSGRLIQRPDGSVCGTEPGYSYPWPGILSVDSNGQFNGIYYVSNSLPTIPALVQDSVGNVFGIIANTTFPGSASVGAGQVFELFAKPMILTPPADFMHFLPGGSARFVVSAVGAPTLSYQWQKNGVNLPNLFGSITTNYFQLSTVTANDVGTYTVVVSNYYGAVSNLWGSGKAAGAILSMTNSVPALPSNSLFSVENFQLFQKNPGYNPYYPFRLIAGSDGYLYGSTGGYLFGNYGQDWQMFSVSTNGNMRWGSDYTSYDWVAAIIQGADHRLYASDGDGFLAIYSPTNGSLIKKVTFGAEYFPAAAGLAQAPDSTLYCQVAGQRGPELDTFDTNLVRKSMITNNSYYLVDALALGKDGTLYGTTAYGGFPGHGTVFRTTNGYVPSWTYAVDWILDPVPPSGVMQGLGGIYPNSIILASDGNLYGTCQGDFGTNSYGSVFSMSTNGTLNWTYFFNGADGCAPNPTLLQATDGNLYGTTYSGGDFGQGAVFEITTNGAYTPIFMFTGGSDGAHPSCGVVQVGDGALFGAASSAGYYGAGTLYRLDLGLSPIPVPPYVKQAVITNGAISLTWNVQAHLKYQLQYADVLASGTWSNLGGPTVATGGALALNDLITNNQRFYRIVLLPATP